MSIDYSLLHVYTESPDRGVSVTLRFYEDPPTISGGAGFQAVQRPQKQPLTAYVGPSDGYAMELALILDRFTAQVRHGRAPDVELDCRKVERMCGQTTSSARPPLLILDANGALQHDVINEPSSRWFVSDPPDWGEADRVGNRRVRQLVTLKFERYVSYDVLTRGHDTATSAPTNTFTATSSVSTFKAAAAKYLRSYGGARWASRLAALNGFRDPTAQLLPGRTYKLPTPSQIKEWEQTTRR